MSRKLLILGGTGEAAALARQAILTFGDKLDVISSLAGRVAKPRPLPGRVRVGGFGGSNGLRRYVEEEKIDFVVDATHPFATVISASALQACEQTGTPHLTLVRPPWPLPPYQKYLEADDYSAAAILLPGLGQRIFLSTGHSGLKAFASIPDMTFVIRVIEPPKSPLPLDSTVIITARPPFSLAGEKALFADNAIDVLVTKNSGGAKLPTKITAAVDAGIPIVLIARPPAEDGEQVASVDEALGWISAQAFGLNT